MTEQNRESTIEHGRMGGSMPVVCRGCRQPWPCPDAVFLPLKDFTKYVCPNDTGYGHSSMWTGAHSQHRAVWSTRDGYCTCGEVLVEEVDDGTRWRVSFELLSPFSNVWGPVSRETSSERDARSQVEGLLDQECNGDIRNVRLERSTTAWEPVTL